MGDKTGISWTDATWNPVRGCSRVSEGCRNCYAERVAARFSLAGMPYHELADQTRPGSKWTGVVRLISDRLADPLRWKKPRRIFVNSMSDLFHESLTNEQIAAVFGVMAAAPHHTFQVLTKRAKRMHEWFKWVGEHGDTRALRRCGDAAHDAGVTIYDPLGKNWQGRTPWNDCRCVWPLPNVWIGVSVENQEAADERIPELLATPAAVRFLSCEPLLGQVILGEVALLGRFIECPDENRGDEIDPCAGCPAIPNDGKRGDFCGAVRGPRIDWVIAGCESGPGARPCDVAWLRSLRDQCEAAGVAYFLKQAKADERGYSMDETLPITTGSGSHRKGRDVIELPYLDGHQHAEFPQC